MFEPDERAAVFERIVVGVAEQLAAEGRLRAALETALVRVAERERSLELLTAEQVGALLAGMKPKTVGNLARAGLLPTPLKVGGRNLWRRGDVAAWVQDWDAAGRSGTVSRGDGQARSQ